MVAKPFFEIYISYSVIWYQALLNSVKLLGIIFKALGYKEKFIQTDFVVVSCCNVSLL